VTTLLTATVVSVPIRQVPVHLTGFGVCSKTVLLSWPVWLQSNNNKVRRVCKNLLLFALLIRQYQQKSRPETGRLKINSTQLA